MIEMAFSEPNWDNYFDDQSNTVKIRDIITVNNADKEEKSQLILLVHLCV